MPPVVEKRDMMSMTTKGTNGANGAPCSINESLSKYMINGTAEAVIRNKIVSDIVDQRGHGSVP